MAEIKAFLFDLDGVIVDTAKYHYIAWKKIAAGLGFDFTPEDNERLKGISREESLEILLGIGNISLGKEEKEQLAREKNNIYTGLIAQMGPEEILPGVKEFLISARKKGIKTALGSASKNAAPILNTLGLLGYFDAVIDGNKISKAKPDPEVFLNGAKELNVLPDECVVFEDAAAGIEAARKGNMKSIGIGKPGILSGADAVLPGFKGVFVEDILKLAKK